MMTCIGLTSANASDGIKIPQNCQELMSENKIANSVLDESLIEEARTRVIYNMTNATTGFEKGRNCLNDLGFDIARDIPVNQIRGYGVGVKIGENCLEDLKKFDYPTSKDTTWIFEPFTIKKPNHDRLCFEFFYGIKD